MTKKPSVAVYLPLEDIMKKLMHVNGYVIAINKEGYYSIFSNEEYAYGEGFRYAEYDYIETLAEAIEKAKDL
jgi:hypothetical protein